MEEEEPEAEKVIVGKPSNLPRGKPKGSQAQTEVKPVPRLGRDFSALHRLFLSATPPERLVRGQLIHAVKYAFGDASKAGFGSSWVGENGVKYRFGT